MPDVTLARVTIAVAVMLAMCGPQATAGAQAPEEDANLEQEIQSGQGVGTGRRTIASGHVDVGPRFVDGKWRLMIHDDVAKAGGGESVWRHPEDAVLRVTDAATKRVPADPAYGFLHAAPGDRVHVVPQTQDPEVVWVGWNTQDPEVMETIDRGVTMKLTGVQGPGDVVVYLQSGSFAEPDVLWDSTGRPKPVWVDVNTHTHANWVFTAPGVYLVRIEVSAKLVGGSTVSDTRELRFAVGSGAGVGEAFAAEWRGPAASEATPAGSGGATPSRAEPGGLGPALVVVASGLAVVLLATVARGRRVKRRARTARGDATAGGDGGA